jgi:hypothetical protein
MMELPAITASTYASEALDVNKLLVGHAGLWQEAARQEAAQQVPFDQAALRRALGQLADQPQPAPVIKQPENKVSARIVKVFIADPTEALPLDKRVIYKGEEKLTDLTDQELFFEVNVGELLKAHNELRAKTVDKKASDKAAREVLLEPIRIRDLKMVVVTVASF